jgi:hypothetical protein
MFKNQSYKHKLSYTQNEDENNIVSINVVLNTNHELEKNIISDISEVISRMFLQEYTNTDDIIQKQKEEKQRAKDIKEHAKNQLKNDKLAEKERIENDKEFDKRVKEEVTKINKISVPKPKTWTRKK